MRQLLSATTILIATLCSISVCAADPPSLAKVTAMLEAGQEPVRIVCFGDSVTGVYYHTGGRRAWTDMLGIALQRAYPKAKDERFNAGLSGHNTVNALARIDRDVLARKPHLVVVMFGLNDITKGNRPLYRTNLKAIIDRCREAGTAVVLCTLNSVEPNGPRPMSAVTEYSQIIRDVAKENAVPVADVFNAYEAVRTKNRTDWLVMMSDEIHPSMEGHKLYAETVAEAISGKRIPLGDVCPPADALQFTLKRLKAGEPVNVIAMPPYDRMIADVLTELFPGAKVNVTVWPVEGKSLGEIVKWGEENVRKQKPNLVVIAVPAGAQAADDETFIREYHWIPSWGASFGYAEWDLLPILPSVTEPVTPAELPRAELARQIIAGSDVEYVERKGDDARPPREILKELIRQRM